MPRHDAATLPVAVERAFELWIWLDARVMDLPVSVRAGLGARLLDVSLGLLDALVQTVWEPRGSAAVTPLLHQANQRIAFARLLLRGALDRRYLSRDQHTFAVERLDAIGRMVGGWLRARSSSAP